MPSPFVAVPSWEAQTDAARPAPAGAAPSEPRGAAEGAGDVATRAPGVAAPPSAASAGVTAEELDALGPLAPYAADGPVTDLFVNGDRGLWIDRGAGAEREPGWAANEAEVRALAVHLIARGGRHVDEATPAVDVRLGRGIRVHAVLPPLSPGGTLISVRVPRVAGFPLAALARAGMLDATTEDTL
ncbi:MAG TPA: type II/type IV pathway secretion protein, partial [Agromyces sp.]